MPFFLNNNSLNNLNTKSLHPTLSLILNTSKGQINQKDIAHLNQLIILLTNHQRILPQENPNPKPQILGHFQIFQMLLNKFLRNFINIIQFYTNSQVLDYYFG
jgi:hypothetical protein